MLRAISILSVVVYLGSEIVSVGQESGVPPQASPEQILDHKTKLQIQVLYHFITLEPVPGLRVSKVLVYDSDLAKFARLTGPNLRARFELTKKRLQELPDQLNEADRNGDKPRYDQLKEERDKRKQDVVTIFEALQKHGLATAKDLDETLSIATTYPQVYTETSADFSGERAGEASRIYQLVEKEREVKSVDYTNAQKRYLVRDLVLGTLRVSFVPEVSPKSPADLELEFEPHTMLSRKVLGQSVPSDEVVKWHVRPEYHAKSIGSTYDFDQSGRKAEERTLDLGGGNKETWVWRISALKDFRSDSSDLVFYLGYETAQGEKKESDVWREKITWIEKIEPGLVARISSWFGPSFSWVLGILAALASAWASWKTIQLRRLELARTTTAEASAPVRSGANQLSGVGTENIAGAIRPDNS